METMSRPAKLFSIAKSRRGPPQWNEPITFSQSRDRPPKNMPPLIIAATTDLFLQSRISETARSVGFEVKFVTDEAGLKEALSNADPKLAILDLSSTDYDPFTAAKALKSLSQSLKILGFYPHVRTDLKARAEKLGMNHIVPNSGLLATLKKLLSTERTTS